jgi:hypothetical protein
MKTLVINKMIPMDYLQSSKSTTFNQGPCLERLMILNISLQLQAGLS